MYGCVAGVSHLVIDEVHTREWQQDVLLTEVKRLLVTRPDLRVVLMSASMNERSLSNYFDNCPIVYVKGRQHDVTDHFLPDYAGRLQLDPHMLESRSQSDKLNIDLLSSLMRHLVVDTSDGGILCFLPGLADIELVERNLRGARFFDSERHIIHRLHSSLPQRAQQLVFEPVDDGQRKIVLATNIAE